MKRIISISTVAFDGYPLPVTLEEIGRLGATHVELAFIEGYTDSFTDDLFTNGRARAIANMLADSGLSCHAFSSHMDLGAKDSVDRFKRRMEFAATIGAKIINTNSAVKKNSENFASNIDTLEVLAEALQVVIGLENPGDGNPSLIDRAADGAALIRRIDSKWIRMNYDFGNLVSHLFQRVRPEEDWVDALPVAAHLHMKDVKAGPQGWHFTEIGKGDIDFVPILSVLREEHPFLPVSLEIPLRMFRGPDALPRRLPSPVDLDTIRGVVSRSFDYVSTRLKVRGKR